MRGNALAIACTLFVAAGSAAGGAPPVPPGAEAPRGLLVSAEILSRAGPGALFAIGNVRLQRGIAVITADAGVIWSLDREAYLEGHVVYRMGQSVIKSERAYVHWSPVLDPASGQEHTQVDRGFLFRGDIRWHERPDEIPWHIRGDEVLQTGVRHFLVRGHAFFSPNLYHQPHTYFRARTIELVTEERFAATNVTYHVQGVGLPPRLQGWWIPPTYWPKLYVPLGWQFPDMTFHFGRSSRFGTYLETEVTYQLPDFIPLVDSEVAVLLDYYSERGFAYGTVFRYEFEDKPRPDALRTDELRGELSYYRVPSDAGQDQGRYELETTDRWRVKFWHSQDMPEGWEFDFEYQRYSDAGFRREYFRHEYREAKPIENRFYLKYSDGPFAAYFHFRWRGDEWLETTEYLPQIGANLFSYPIWRNLLYTGHIELAYVRRRLSELRADPFRDFVLVPVTDEEGLPIEGAAPLRVLSREYRERVRRWNFFSRPLVSTPQEALSDRRGFLRLNTYHQLSLPFKWSIFHIEPFVGARLTWYGKTLASDSSKLRTIFVYGARVATQFWRAWDDAQADSLRILGVKVLPLEINGIRHIITPELRLMSIEQPSMGTDELILTDEPGIQQPVTDLGYPVAPLLYRPYDPTGFAFGDVDAINPVRVINLGLLNRWQTRRSGRVVNFIELDADIDLYLDPDRDNFGDTFSDFRLDFRFSPITGVYFYTDFDYRFQGGDPERARGFTTFNTGLTIATSEKWRLVLSQRYEVGEDTRWGIRFFYKPSEKWWFDVRYEYDTSDDEPIEISVRVTRDFHDWYLELVFEEDPDERERLTGITLRPKFLRQLFRGIQYTRELGAGEEAELEESYQYYDY